MDEKLQAFIEKKEQEIRKREEQEAQNAEMARKKERDSLLIKLGLTKGAEKKVYAKSDYTNGYFAARDGYMNFEEGADGTRRYYRIEKGEPIDITDDEYEKLLEVLKKSEESAQSGSPSLAAESAQTRGSGALAAPVEKTAVIDFGYEIDEKGEANRIYDEGSRAAKIFRVMMWVMWGISVLLVIVSLSAYMNIWSTMLPLILEAIVLGLTFMCMAELYGNVHKMNLSLVGAKVRVLSQSDTPQNRFTR